MADRYIIAPYDATTRRGGTAEAAHRWRTIAPTKRTVSYERFLGPLLPTIVEFEVLTACRRRQIPFTLGGDHSLTYHALKAVVSHYGAVNIVHFDAHHDAYQQTQLNHFTVFYHLKRRLPVTIFPVGHRYEVEAIAPELKQPVKGYTYISVDVDYFDPALVSSVVHAVPCTDKQGRCDLQAFERSLAMIDGPVVGLDLVEWMGATEGSDEHHLITHVFSMLDAKCNTADVS